MFKIESKLRKCQENLENIFFEIIASENVPLNCPYEEENTS